MVRVNYRPLIKALSLMEEPIIAPMLYSNEPMSDEDESNVEPSYDQHGQAIFSQKMKKNIAFRKRVKEANSNPKPTNLVSQLWLRLKLEPCFCILKKVMLFSEVREYIHKITHDL